MRVMVAFCYHDAMAQPVKLSDALVLDARLEGEIQQRSIAGQVEYWARLGKVMDALLDGRVRNEALRNGDPVALSELVAAVGRAEGDARLKSYLGCEPFPHFEAHPTRKGMLIRTEEDGRRSVGRFVNRHFVVDRSEKPAAHSLRKRKGASAMASEGLKTVLRQSESRSR